MLSVNPDAIPRSASVGLDTQVLLFTLATAAITGIVFGLAPLMHLSSRLSIALRDGSRGTTVSGVRKALRGALVVSQVTLAVVLVVGAALLVRSFVNLTRVDTGFDRAQLLTFGVVLPVSSYTAPRRMASYAALEARLRAIPGVQSVGGMTGLPPNRPVNANDTDFEHITPPPMGASGTQATLLPAENVDYYQTVTPGYFETMGIPIVSGRAFEPADAGGGPVVLINETLARRFYSCRGSRASRPRT
ncbi:MAG: ABC transporter permease [Acidobacteria bacterium]|nr:ABC transporter permease [Acidobacteriota bacterium]